MWTRAQHLEERNYHNDRRVRVATAYAERDADEENMVIRFSVEDYDGEEYAGDTVVELPACYGVCPVCEGKGKHVNPSIDASGWSQEDDRDDWQDDDDWRDEDDGEPKSAYQRGLYDVVCYTCKGKRVVLEVDERRAKPEDLSAWREKLEEDAEYEREVRAEREYGC